MLAGFLAATGTGLLISVTAFAAASLVLLFAAPPLVLARGRRDVLPSIAHLLLIGLAVLGAGAVVHRGRRHLPATRPDPGDRRLKP